MSKAKNTPQAAGYNEEEHAVFEIGVHDGVHAVANPPVQCLGNSPRSLGLRTAWMKGRALGAMNRHKSPNATGSPTPEVKP